MPCVLGCIADDITGATDFGSALVNGGMRVVQFIGTPDDGATVPEADALVVALKTRSAEPAFAVRQSLAAWNWLCQQGVPRMFFKYSSTFDSTPTGNIGPVAESLLAACGSPMAIACPAFPDNGRTVYQGHLFVGQQLLSESGMEKHPLNPMIDPNLVRVLRRQTQGEVGLLPHEVVRRGTAAIRDALSQIGARGRVIVFVDALTNEDLEAIAAACADQPLMTGGAGIAAALPKVYRRAGFWHGEMSALAPPSAGGFSAVIAGSCSQMTLQQVECMRHVSPAVALNAEQITGGEDVSGRMVAWARDHLSKGPVLVYSSALPHDVERLQQRLGPAAGEAVERILAQIAVGLVESGVRRLVVAGGETSGAVLAALGIKALRIGGPIAPGVPWTETIGEPRIALALKSGNFGDEDFFLKALDILQ